LDIDGVQGIKDVPRVEDRAVAASDKGELGYLCVDELPKAREKVERFGSQPARGQPRGQPILELGEIRLEITGELQ